MKLLSISILVMSILSRKLVFVFNWITCVVNSFKVISNPLSVCERFESNSSSIFSFGIFNMLDSSLVVKYSVIKSLLVYVYSVSIWDIVSSLNRLEYFGLVNISFFRKVINSFSVSLSVLFFEL